jgi:hypothetical protein
VAFSGTNSNGSVFFKELTSRGPLDKKIIQWLLTLHQIGLDVNRTDRALVFYEKKENLSKLWDILSVYAWIDNDVGYCQGMSDLCSPMIILLEDEADAFWCFERLMRRLVVLNMFYFFELKSEEISVVPGDLLELKLNLLICLQLLRLLTPNFTNI